MVAQTYAQRAPLLSADAGRHDRLLIASFFLVVAVKLALVSDLAIIVQYAPHDDSLYVVRAYHLLLGEGFGPYDSRVLAKNPGLSFLLAGMRVLGIPFLLAVNLIYLAAGAYFARAALRSGCSRWVVLIAFVLYVFNPATLGAEWIRVFREPLSTALLVALLGAMLHLLVAAREHRPLVVHAVALCVLFAVVRTIREEDILYYALLAAFALVFLWEVRRWRAGSNRRYFGPLVIVLATALAGWAAMTASRAFISAHYGLPIVHDFNEGEFPKLIAAIRQVEAKKDNRMVMITQERLAKLTVHAPSLRPVIERLPRPGLNTFSCRRDGVCSEWGNGWMLFWIKDAAYEAGLTPDLRSAQAYFRKARLEIESACGDGRLVCRPTGDGLLPSFELRWTRAYVHELFRLIAMTGGPNTNPIAELPQVFNVSTELARVYQETTMTHRADTKWRASLSDDGKSLAYRNPLASSRLALSGFYGTFAKWLFIAALICLAIRAIAITKNPPSPLILLAWVFIAFTAVRLAALAYVATYFGHFDPRMVFPIYSVMLILSPLIIADTARALAARPRAGLRPQP